MSSIKLNAGLIPSLPLSASVVAAEGIRCARPCAFSASRPRPSCRSVCRFDNLCLVAGRWVGWLCWDRPNTVPGEKGSNYSGVAGRTEGEFKRISWTPQGTPNFSAQGPRCVFLSIFAVRKKICFTQAGGGRMANGLCPPDCRNPISYESYICLN